MRTSFAPLPVKPSMMDFCRGGNFSGHSLIVRLGRPDTRPLRLASLRGRWSGHKDLMRPLPPQRVLRPSSPSDLPCGPIRRADEFLCNRATNRACAENNMIDCHLICLLLCFHGEFTGFIRVQSLRARFRGAPQLPHVPSLPRDQTWAYCHTRFRTDRD